jgi:uncharacterized protein YecE (DUF72 family)
VSSPPKQVRIGISGWDYPNWRKVFYPDGLPHKDELAFASRAVDSIEINGSFYSLLRPDCVKRWRLETPDDFVFAVKGSRFITHMKKLHDVDAALPNFFASGVLALEEKLGPILWQLPPTMAFDSTRLAGFLERLPRTTRAAVEVAAKHDDRVRDRCYVHTFADRPLRYAVEARHPSFHDPEFIALLRRHHIALCIADTAGLFPDFEDVTADFVYVRLHGDTKLYESGYTPQALKRWAFRVDAWSHGREVASARLAAPDLGPERRATRDVYVYFDNDAKVRAPFDAIALRELVDSSRAAVSRSSRYRYGRREGATRSSRRQAPGRW